VRGEPRLGIDKSMCFRFYSEGISQVVGDKYLRDTASSYASQKAKTDKKKQTDYGGCITNDGQGEVNSRRRKKQKRRSPPNLTRKVNSPDNLGSKQKRKSGEKKRAQEHRSWEEEVLRGEIKGEITERGGK